MLIRKSIAEAIGTYLLVLFGTGAMVVATEVGYLTHSGVSAVWGLAVMCIIVAIGSFSGAHINPAVTIAFAASGRFSWKKVPAYVIGQCAGAILASCSIWLAFPMSETLGATLPSVDIGVTFAIEVLCTFFLMYVILSVSHNAKEVGMFASVAIGAVVAISAFVAGPLTGASLNPARSLGPALLSGQLQYLWLYLAAPISGALLAPVIMNLLKQNR